MKIKNIVISWIMMAVMVLGMAADVNAAETEKEWYEIEIVDQVGSDLEQQDFGVQPYGTRYIMNILSHIKQTGSKTAALGSDVFCSHEMAKIEVYIQLQKLNDNNVWVTVGENSSASYNTPCAYKQATVRGLKPGVYRCRSTAVVMDEFGYSEFLSSMSSGVRFS